MYICFLSVPDTLSLKNPQKSSSTCHESTALNSFHLELVNVPQLDFIH